MINYCANCKYRFECEDYNEEEEEAETTERCTYAEGEYEDD